MRITGLATGLDMDEIIKNSMKPYNIKVDQTTQKKDVVEIKQKLYRDILKDSREFFNKHLDIAKSDSLLKEANWSSVSFSSSNEDAVTVKGDSEARQGNYTISGSKATAAKAVITDNIKDGEKLVINGKEFTLKGTNDKEIEKDLNNQLTELGMNITVRYSQFAGGVAENKSGLILESSILGENSTFTVGGTATSIATVITPGENATVATVTGFNIQDIKDNNGKITMDTTEIDFGIVPEDIDTDIIQKMNDKLSQQKLSVSKDDSGNITFSSTLVGSASLDPQIKINGSTGTFTSGNDATSGSVAFDKTELSSGEKTLIIGGKAIKIDLPLAVPGDTQQQTNEKQENYLNDLFKKNQVGVNAEVTNSGIKLTSTSTGVSSSFDVSTTSGQIAQGGKDANITITDSKGGVYTHTGNTNTVTLDNITFKFTGEIPAEGVKITGKTDVKNLKDKIVGFVNDYNKYIEKLNTTVMTKHDRSYLPLTADQKKDMSESEVKLWNERVEKGQLYKDSDVTRIASSMKESMRTFMESSALNLQKIGIEPVKDYAGTLNGTFTIDEDKLNTALENNTEDVMKLFTTSAPTESELSTLSEEDKMKRKSQTGILCKLKDTLDKEVMKSSTSYLLKKAGFQGTASFSNNELTKSISNYEKKIKDMQKDVSRREQALYSKYAKLETMMNKLNSQQSNLMSQLGMA